MRCNSMYSEKMIYSVAYYIGIDCNSAQYCSTDLQAYLIWRLPWFIDMLDAWRLVFQALFLRYDLLSTEVFGFLYVLISWIM